MFHHEFRKPRTYGGVKRSKVNVTRQCQRAWVFALLWVPASSSWVRCSMGANGWSDLSLQHDISVRRWPELCRLLQQDSSLPKHQRRRMHNATAPTKISARTMTVAHTTDAMMTSLPTSSPSAASSVAISNGPSVDDGVRTGLPVTESFPVSTTWTRRVITADRGGCPWSVAVTR